MPKIKLDGFMRSDAEDDRISLEIASLFATPTGQSVLKHLRSISGILSVLLSGVSNMQKR
jgi:hypothetical protein